MKRILCLILVLLMLPAWIISCNDDPAVGPGPDTTNTDKPLDPNVGELLGDDKLVLVRDGATNYRVVRPDRANKAEATSASNIIDTINGMCGVELGIVTDDEAATEYEILVGPTNRPESAAAIASLADNMFSITISGNKVVIAAKNDVMVECAVTYFLDNYVENVPSVKGTFSLAKDINHTSSGNYIVFDKPADGNYMVTYPQAEKDYQNYAAYPGEKLYNLEYHANTVYTTLKNSKTAGVVISTDKLVGGSEAKAEWKEILVGSTTRTATQSVKETLDFDEFAIKVVDNDIVITGLGFGSTKAAVEKFIEVIEFFKDESSGNPLYRLPADFSYKAKMSEYSRWPNAPKYTGGVIDSVTDGGDESYVAVYNNTNKDEYNAYLADLSAQGYTKYFENEMNGNLYAIYKNDSIVINAYFIPSSSSVRIVAEKVFKVTLPALESENVYTDKGLQSSITQMKLNNVTDSNGQCHIFKLCDGRFIVVDGGGNDTKSGKSDADNLVALLKSMSGGEKPVVAAWFISHPHSDHYNVLLEVGSKYKNDITVESFIYNFPVPEMTNDTNQKKITDNVTKAMKSFKDAKIIKAHTGQKYYIANAEIEMLFAPEFIYPYFTTFGNDFSLVFMVNIGGTKTLITADASPNTTPVISAMYGDYLKCDVLQIAHHGSIGGTMDFYKLTNPSKLALLPVGKTQEARLKNQPENVYIGRLVKIICHFQGNYTYDLPAKN